MSTTRKLLVVYGSETGNCEAISKRIHQDATGLQFNSSWYSLQHFKKIGLDKPETWPRDCVLIFVVSSTGQGDPPQNAETFWRVLRRMTGDQALNNVHFALLGLGSSDYDSYQGFPTALQEKLLSLGAKEVTPRGKADEAVGLENVVEPWIEDLWVDLNKWFEKQEEQIKLSAPPPAQAPAAPAAAAPTTVATPAPATAAKAQAAPAAPAAAKKPRTVKPIQNVSQLMYTDDPQQIAIEIDSQKSHPTRQNPFNAPLLWGRQLTSPLAEKQAIQLSVSIRGSGINLQPGQAFGVLAPNQDDLVLGLIERLRSSPLNVNDSALPDFDKPVLLRPLNSSVAAEVPKHIHGENGKVCTLRYALKHCVDLTGLPSKRFLATLAEYCENSRDKDFALALSSNPVQYRESIENTKANLLDLLNLLPSCRIPISHLLDCLPALQPRYYSVANSPSVYPDEAHFVFVVVDVQLPGNKQFKGLASNYMQDIARKANIISPLDTPLSSLVAESRPSEYALKIFPRELPIDGQHFVMDSDTMRPMVMVGPGTGVAPFVGFLQHRRYLRDKEQKPLGKALLFFGCRHPDHDFLLRQELESFQEDGTVSKLVTAFSRYDGDRVYVQDRMKEEENAKEIAKIMLEENGLFYFCGDVLSMLKDVRDALAWILKEHGKLTEKEATDTLTKWSKERRFLVDIWS